MLTIIIITSFIFVSLATMTAFFLFRWIFAGSEATLDSRMAELSGRKDGGTPAVPLVLRDDQLSRVPLLNRTLQKLHLARNLRRLIEQADLSLTVGELMLIMLVLAGLGGVASLRMHNLPVTVASIFLLGGIPLLYVQLKRKKRVNLFTEQFPDALDMMTSALRAGHSLSRAMQLVANEAPDPAGLEFRKTFEEQNLGLPMKEALVNLTHRIPCVDLELFTAAVLIQRESGGNLTEILTNLSKTIRDRFKLLGQIKIYTAQGRFYRGMLGALPVAMAFIIYATNPQYVMMLWTEPLGRFMLAAALILQIIGFLVIRRIVNLKTF
jgi:tight adherence protein B